jgi:predicted nucleic acid-binding protein
VTGGVTGGVTLDAGPLLRLDRNDRRVIVLLAVAAERRAIVTVPSTALAQAIRDPARQARLSRLLRQPNTVVAPLDRLDATTVGRLLATSATTDIADAHVVVCARRTGHAIVTTDPDDLHRLAPNIELIAL